MKISKPNISIALQKISKKTKLSEIINKNSKATERLIESGMHCIGCPMLRQETLEQGCIAHGMDKKEIENLIQKLNK